MLEQKIQSKIIDYLHSKGAHVTKTMKSSKGGVPDILCCYRGRYFAFEVKRPSEKPRELQEYQMGKVRKAGGIAAAVSSLDDVKDVLDNAVPNVE